MLLKDSRGDKTVTLTILVVSWIALTIKLMFGVDGGWTTPMNGSEYAYAITPFLGAFGFREFKAKQ